MSTSRGGTLERGGAVERSSTIERGSTLQMGGTLERGGAQLRYSGEGNESLANHAQLQHTNSAASAATATVVPPPYSTGGAGGGAEPAGLELRDSLDCWACSVLVTAQNMVIAVINLALAAAVFGLILTPAIFMVTFGFLCHSTVRPHGTSELCSELLSDGGCVALLVIGFLLVTPLLVLALAAYCRLARHLQLGLCFIPYSRAVYKNLPASRHRGLPCCSQGAPGSMNKGSVWV